MMRKPFKTPGHGATGRNPLTEGLHARIPLECYLEAKPESGFIWEPYKRKLGRRGSGCLSTLSGTQRRTNMEDRKPIDVRVPNIRGICIGFVDFDPGPEALQLALDLTQRWNPLVYQELVTLRPNVDIRAFRSSTADGLVGLLKGHLDRTHPDCDMIVQSGSFQILRQSTGTRNRVDVVLATYHKNQGARVTVIAGDNLTLRPASHLPTFSVQHEQKPGSEASAYTIVDWLDGPGKGQGG